MYTEVDVTDGIGCVRLAHGAGKPVVAAADGRIQAFMDRTVRSRQGS
jgi:hypothetical protein